MVEVRHLIQLAPGGERPGQAADGHPSGPDHRQIGGARQEEGQRIHAPDHHWQIGEGVLDLVHDVDREDRIETHEVIASGLDPPEEVRHMPGAHQAGVHLVPVQNQIGSDETHPDVRGMVGVGELELEETDP